MNLKEAFRYQKFLDKTFTTTCLYLESRDNCLTTTKTHFKSKVNPEAEDIQEVVEKEVEYSIEDLIALVNFLIEQRRVLTLAINKTKREAFIDIDAAVETNKFKQNAARSLKRTLGYKARTLKESGRDYKFNVDGNQTMYCYEIETVYSENFDKKEVKEAMSKLTKSADTISAEIDSIMVNSAVNYIAPFDVNDTFEDVMEAFVTK